ncbi:hypothetical protein ABW19_dt0206943 [Dactylella cylindrospora]|nr:hypothetical protein ABW19_dt0206943 [Dactylella cylindrospora]
MAYVPSYESGPPTLDLEPPGQSNQENDPKPQAPFNIYVDPNERDSNDVMMTTAQAASLLGQLGLSDKEIHNMAENGVTHFPASPFDFYDLPPPFINTTNMVNSKTHLGLAPYGEVDPNVQRSALHIRPKTIIPPYKPVKFHPGTLNITGDGRGFKPRDPSMVIIYVVGPPASGKTTIAKSICEQFHFKYIGVEELLQRERENPESPYKNALENMQSKGLPGPYRLVPSILISEISKYVEKGLKEVFVIDGFPHDLNCVEYFEETIQPCDRLFHLNCSPEVSFTRILPMEKAVPEDCGHIEASFRKRLCVYQEESEIIIHYFKRQGKVSSIDAGMPLNQVQAQVKLIVKDMIIIGFVANRKETTDEVNKKAWESIRDTLERKYMKDGYMLWDSNGEGEQLDEDMQDTNHELNDQPGAPPTYASGSMHPSTPLVPSNIIEENSNGLAAASPQPDMSTESASECEDMRTKNAGKTPVAHRISIFGRNLRKRVSLSSASSKSSGEENRSSPIGRSKQGKP